MPRVDVRLIGPQVVFAGEPVDLSIELTPHKPTVVSQMTVAVVGTNGCSSLARANAQFTHERREQLALLTYVPGALTQPRRLPLRFALPPYAPTSHSLLGLAHAALLLKVHLVLPFRFDINGVIPLHVRRRQPPFIPEPATARDERDERRLEVSVSSSRITPGASLLGTCALSGLAEDESHEASLRLVARVGLLGGGETERTFRVQRLVLPAGTTGSPIPFEFAIPRDTASSVLTNTHVVSWMLRVRAARREAEISIEIVDEPTTDAPPTAPLVGVSRVEPEMKTFADSAGWSFDREIVAGDPTLGTLFPSVTREAGNRKLVLACSYRGKAGAFVIARARYAALALGLAVAPTSWTQRFARDLQAGVPAWDRAYHATANEPEAARALIAAVVPAIPAELGRLVRWDDEEIVFERAGDRVDQSLLVELGDGLDAVVDAIDTHRMNAVGSAGPYR